MATPVSFGGGDPIRVDVSSGNGPWICPDADILDVGMYYGAATMSLALVGLEGSTPVPELQMILETAMDLKFTRSYSLGMFTALSSLDPTNNQRDARDFRRIQRYLRWKITGKGTNVTSYTFLLQGTLYQAR